MSRRLVLSGLLLAVVTMAVPAGPGFASETVSPQRPAAPHLTEVSSWHEGVALLPDIIRLRMPVEQGRQPGFSSVQAVGARGACQAGQRVRRSASRRASRGPAQTLFDLYHAYLL